MNFGVPAGHLTVDIQDSDEHIVRTPPAIDAVTVREQQMTVVLLTRTNVKQQLTLRIVLQHPPAGVDFGVQVGRGADYEVVQKQRSQGGDLHFACSVVIRTAGRNTAPDFSGAVVQGPAAQRFVYIAIGSCAGQADTPWSRRLKIPLNGITWELVDRALADGTTVLETRVPGTARDGGPNCATVKPFAGWTFART